MLVIFGAGASHDVAQMGNIWSTPTSGSLEHWPAASPDEFRPPLTPQLFRGALIDRLLDRYGAASHLIHDARMQVARDAQAFEVEKFLANYAGSSIREDARAVLATRFLLRDYFWACTQYCLSQLGPGHANNYAGLLGRVNRWCRPRNEPLAVVSFNYDLLAEHAFGNVMNKRLEALPWYVSDSDRLLIKPHGSCNWARALYTGADEVRARYIDHVTAAQAALREWEWTERHSDEIELVPRLGSGALPTVPALALPIEGKPGPVCPQTHLDALARTLDGPLSVITVGWRGADDWFLDWLGEHTARLRARALICMAGSRAKDDGHQLAAKLQGKLTDCEAALHLEGFSKLQTSTELAAFLED